MGWLWAGWHLAKVSLNDRFSLAPNATAKRPRIDRLDV